MKAAQACVSVQSYNFQLNCHARHHTPITTDLMPLHLTAAASSRVTKQRPAKKPVFSTAPRRKPAAQNSSGGSGARKAAGGRKEGDAAAYLGHANIVQSLPDYVGIRTLPGMIRHAQEAMFMPVPERGSGMNSSRVAEVRAYQASLPPVATVAHLHAAGLSATDVDRELAEWVRDRKIRKIAIPGASSECVVLVEDWVRRVRAEDALPEEVRGKSFIVSCTSRC